MTVAHPHLIGSVCSTGAILGQESGFRSSLIPGGYLLFWGECGVGEKKGCGREAGTRGTSISNRSVKEKGGWGEVARETEGK